jgi:hypothetical protein
MIEWSICIAYLSGVPSEIGSKAMWLIMSICIAYLSGVPSEIGSKAMWLIMDISFISDGWSHARNPGRLPGRSGQRFSTTATTTSKSSRSYGSADRTS